MRRGALVLLALLIVAGCGSAETTPGTAAGTGPDGSQAIRTDGDITVFAAASLQQVFTRIGDGFTATHPDVRVGFSFAGSADLATQIVAGAPADVFAAASTTTMTTVVDAGLAAGEPVDVATNTLAIVTPPGDPAGVASFADLAEAGLDVVVCAPQVPCGAATAKVAADTGVRLAPVSEESSVTDVLGKVTSGQADAGIVYVTDARGAGDAVATVPFPEAAGAVNTYPAVAVQQSRHPGSAAAFLSYLRNADAQQVLADAGFGPP